MPDASDKTPTPEAPQTVLDQAMQQLEAFIADLEEQQQKAEERARVPEDVPRFVTRYEP